MGVNVGSYQATLTIPEFKGVMQFDENESVNTDMRYAATAVNFETRDGTLLPIVLPTLIATGNGGYGPYGPVKSMHAFRRCISPTIGDMTDKTLMVVGSGGHIALGEAGSPWLQYDNTLTPDGFLSSEWSAVQYMKTSQNVLQDVLIVSNAKDGMYMFWGNSGFLVQVSGVPYNFGLLALHGERVWGSGIEGHPDLIVYSAPFDPTDWTQNTSIPEDGAGEVRQPTFDGEAFTALLPFGNTLLAFKETSLWRITGMSPDEYAFQRQYGGGTIFPRTVVTNQEQVFFLTPDGVCVYDGVSVKPFQQNALRTIWRDILWRNLDIHRPVGILWDNKYIISFPREQSGDHNEEAIIYDFKEGTWSRGAAMPYGDGYVEIDGKLFLARPYVDTATERSTSQLFRWFGSIEDVSVREHPNAKPTAFNGFTWTSPWSDMGAKDVLKHDFKVRFWIQTHTDLLSSGANSGKLKLKLMLETERGSKTREIVFTEDVDKEIKMRFHLSGKKVRFRISTRDADDNATMNCWCRILGGMQINADTSPE